MTRFVLDPLSLLDLARNGRSHDPAHRLVGPNSIRSEALQLLLDGVARGEVSDAAALALHESMTEVKMRLLGDRVSRRTAWKIARERGWPTLRDAEYLAITRLQADALVASDAELARKARGIVPLAGLDRLFVS